MSPVTTAKNITGHSSGAAAIVQLLQLVTLLVGVGSVAVMLGRRDAAIEQNLDAIRELRAVTSDLAKAQTAAATAGIVNREKIADLIRRLDALERRP